jgi:hypothetical protein
MLGELLYERGELDEAERLLDEGYKIGPEGGSVDFKIARYITGARIKMLRAIGRQRSNGSTRPPGSRGRCHCTGYGQWWRTNESASDFRRFRNSMRSR